MGKKKGTKDLATLFALGLHQKYFTVIPDKIWPAIQVILNTYEKDIAEPDSKQNALQTATEAIIKLKQTCDPYQETDAIIVLIQLERFIDMIFRSGISIATTPEKWELETDSLKTIHELLRYHRSTTELQQEIGRKCIHKLYGYIYANYTKWQKLADLFKSIFSIFYRKKKDQEITVHSEFLDHLINLLQRYRDGQHNRNEILSYLKTHQKEYDTLDEEEIDDPHNIFYTIEYVKELLTYLDVNH